MEDLQREMADRLGDIPIVAAGATLGPEARELCFEAGTTACATRPLASGPDFSRILAEYLPCATRAGPRSGASA